MKNIETYEELANELMELTDELIEWKHNKNPAAVVPALLMMAAKVAVDMGDKNRLRTMLSVLETSFNLQYEEKNRT